MAGAGEASKEGAGAGEEAGRGFPGPRERRVISEAYRRLEQEPRDLWKPGI